MTTRITRWAWWGRTSTEDLQDPTLSLPRQLNTSQVALPPGAIIVAHFWDIESGRKDLDLRGHGHAHEQFAIPIPRDGGIQDLLTEAARPDRRFDAVICESIDRVARRTYYGTKIEHDLERAGVLLVAADEPMQSGRKRATAILTRRVKQGVAEWYVLEALEKAWAGFEEHARQGFNVGRPPYGYRADRIPHPVPARREQGKTKTRLMLDPIRAGVVRHIFDLYLGTGMGLLLIRDHLNADPVKFPPPVPPDPRRALGRWSTSSIWEILRNPKYTGFMVWNRRARKSARNKANPPSEWVWSPEPTHPAIITMDEYQAVTAKATEKERSRRAKPDDEQHHRTVYLYRGLVRCGICGLRMVGNYRRQGGRRYYFCYPAKQRSAKIPAEHPPTIYLAEPDLHQAVTEWLSRAILGPDRVSYWQAAVGEAGAAGREEDHTEERREEIERDIDDLTRRLRKQVLNLEDDGISKTTKKQITDRIAELETQIDQLAALATEIKRQDEDREPTGEEIADALARLPELADRLGEMPQDQLRELYDSLDLKISYRPQERVVEIEVTLASQVCSVPPAGHAAELCKWGLSDAPGRAPSRPRAVGGDQVTRADAHTEWAVYLDCSRVRALARGISPARSLSG